MKREISLEPVGWFCRGAEAGVGFWRVSKSSLDPCGCGSRLSARPPRRVWGAWEVLEKKLWNPGGASVVPSSPAGLARQRPLSEHTCAGRSRWFHLLGILPLSRVSSRLRTCQSMTFHPSFSARQLVVCLSSADVPTCPLCPGVPCRAAAQAPTVTLGGRCRPVSSHFQASSLTLVHPASWPRCARSGQEGTHRHLE